MLTGMPGIGGGLGQCAVCGHDFTKELLMGKNVHTFSMSAFDSEMCAHEKCMDSLAHARDNGWETLPDGPIRKAFNESAAEERGEQEGM
jgi:hypothetical protein